MRAFVAVDVPPAGPGVPTAGAPAHFTLVFFGGVDEARVPGYAAALADAVRPVPPFPLALGGFGAFPSPDRPRVVFRTVTAGSGPLERLATAAREAARSLSLSLDERPFVPHLTVLRVRRPRDEEKARRLLDGPPPAGAEPFEVREVLLKESLLDPAGAVHRVIARCPLLGEGSSP